LQILACGIAIAAVCGEHKQNDYTAKVPRAFLLSGHFVAFMRSPGAFYNAETTALCIKINFLTRSISLMQTRRVYFY
jgi:hypothetical protein